MSYDSYNVCSGNVLRVNQIKFKWKVRKSRLPFQSIYFIFFSPGKDGLKLSHCLQSHQFLYPIRFLHRQDAPVFDNLPIIKQATLLQREGDLEWPSRK